MKKSQPEQEDSANSKEETREGRADARNGSGAGNGPDGAGIHFLDRQLRDFIQVAAQPIMVLDTQFRIVTANGATCEILGIDEEGLFGKKCHNMFHGSSSPASGCPMKAMLERSCIETVEMEVETVHGTFLVSCIPVFDASGHLAGAIHMATDITEKKKSDALLRQQEEKYKYFFNDSPAGMFRTTLEGKVVDANSALLKAFGVKENESLMAADFYGNPEDRERVIETIRKKKAVKGLEIKMRKKDDSFIWALMSARLNEQQQCIEGILFDITPQKKAEEALRESEERYRTAIESSNDCVAIFRDGVYVYVNQKYVETLGIDDPAEILGTKIGQFIHPDDYGRIDRYREIRKAGGDAPSRYELRIVRKDGRVLYFEASISTITLKGEPATLVSMRDITDRKETEKKLEEQVHFLQTLIDAMPNPIFIKDPEGKYLLCNKAFEDYHGVSRSEVKGKNVFHIRPLDEADIHWAKDLALLKSSGTVEYESVLIDPSGKTHNVIDRKATFLKPDGTLGGIVGVIIDITELKRAEELLRESEAKYRSIAEESHVGFYIIQNGLFRYVNKRLCEIIGYSYDEVVDRMAPLDIAYDEDRHVVEENLRKRFQGEIDSIRYGFRIKRKDGHIARVEVIGGVCNYRGKPAASGTLLDITKETMLEQQLQQAQKMEAIGQLAGGIAHDFNNILTTVIGYCSLLQMEMGKDDPQALYVDQIRIASEKAAQFTSSLLAFSRKQVMELTTQRFNILIKGVEKLLERMLPEDVVLKILPACEDATIIADSAQIYQLLMNLTANARDAMPRGGVLTIETGTTVIDEDFIAKKGFGEKGHYALLSVSDSGEGMDARTKEKIFEPFFTTKEPGRGTGLGLSVVYGIVKQHNGFINVESEPGKGTAFFVYFPVVKERKERKRSKSKELTYRGGNETVLIAEDSDDVRDLTREVLRKAGYNVIEAADGLEAISLFQEDPGGVDLAVLDVVMPKKNGKEVYDEITRIRPDMKVLFVSGYTADVLIDKGIPDWSFEYLPKPVSPVLLLRKVRDLLDKK